MTPGAKELIAAIIRGQITDTVNAHPDAVSAQWRNSLEKRLIGALACEETLTRLRSVLGSVERAAVIAIRSPALEPLTLKQKRGDK